MTNQHYYILYGTLGCHLCELAYQVCLDVMPAENVVEKDIIDDETLVTMYSTTIPVLERTADGSKLFWPFTPQDILELR
jgi:hypothetical protein